MAILASEALRYDVFRDICSSESMKVEFGDPPYPRWLKNTNKLLSMYGGTYGVKTGFTDEAGRCLVSACERDGKNLVCVTLNDRDDWNDHMAMYDFAFGQVHTFEPDIPQDIELPLAGGSSDTIKAKAQELPAPVTSVGEEELSYTVISPPFIYAPVNAGDKLAELSISCRGREIRRIPLYAAENAAYKSAPAKKKKSGRKLFGGRSCR
jgi:D-alanyl-D-alanine carboxypeptidase/D-alanyl-D-alanine carboxypeptidase (penicillin-binding protein 5/6)